MCRLISTPHLVGLLLAATLVGCDQTATEPSASRSTESATAGSRENPGSTVSLGGAESVELDFSESNAADDTSARPPEPGEAGLENPASADPVNANPSVPSNLDLPPTAIVAEPTSLTEIHFVLVPGDPGKSIDPFYIATTELTWNHFKQWAFCEDLSDSFEISDLRGADLRPSPGYGDMSQGMGYGDRPALRMSKLAAERYCEWLSEQTGQTVRLPTESEWDHAYELGQGPLDVNPPNVDDIAWHFDNCGDETQAVGTSQPNTLGVYDMLGNVWEWVDGTEEDGVVRGGSYWEFPDELMGSLRLVQDMEVWNAGYPNEPKSKWWFVDQYNIGIRLVVEP